MREKITPKTPELSEVRFAADESLQSLLRRAQELCSEPKLSEVIRAGLKVLVEKKEKALGLIPVVKKKKNPLRYSENARSIRMDARREVALKSGGQCEYVDASAQPACGGPNLWKRMDEEMD